MKGRWTITKLVAIGGLAVLDSILQLSGAAVVAVSGIPLTSGFINGLIGPAVIVFTCLLIDKFGAATIERLIFGILIIPLPLGAVAFLPKIVVQFGRGFLSDILYQILKRNKTIASFITGAVGLPCSIFTTILIGRLGGMPDVEKAVVIFFSPLMLVASFVVGAIGGCLGYLVYQKVKDTAVVKRIQA